MALIKNIKFQDSEGNTLLPIGCNIVRKTWAELKALRDAGKLEKGVRYRITDYQCTTTQEDTQSAGHQFDIIVTALSPSKLSEEASAMRSDGDENFFDATSTTASDGTVTKTAYFANSKLEAWKVWYCLDNDTSRFAWADTKNGKGVIYRLIDEWNNDVPYDFKNVKFKRYKIDYTKAYAEDEDKQQDIETFPEKYTFLNTIRELAKKNPILEFAATDKCINTDLGSYYGVDDEEIGIEFESQEIKLFFKADKNLYSNFYTFQSAIDYIRDSSLGNRDKGERVYNNSFLNTGLRLSLKANIFVSKNVFGNRFEGMFSDNIFSGTVSSCTFSGDVQYNTFSGDVYYNTFSGYVWNNTFSGDVYNNTFSGNVQCNTFSGNVWNNTFSGQVSNSTFSGNVYYNTFSGDVYYNTFSGNVNYNTFSGDVYNNTFSGNLKNSQLEGDCEHCLFPSGNVQYIRQCGETKGKGADNMATVSVQTDVKYEQVVTADKDGNIVVKTPWI